MDVLNGSDERIQKLKEIGRGRLNYFRMASLQGKLKDIDGWLRSGIWANIRTGWPSPTSVF